MSINENEIKNTNQVQVVYKAKKASRQKKRKRRTRVNTVTRSKKMCTNNLKKMSAPVTQNVNNQLLVPVSYYEITHPQIYRLL